MTLRDYFAGQALNGMVNFGDLPMADAAKTSYDYADALMEERRKRREKWDEVVTMTALSQNMAGIEWECEQDEHNEETEENYG